MVLIIYADKVLILGFFSLVCNEKRGGYVSCTADTVKCLTTASYKKLSYQKVTLDTTCLIAFATPFDYYMTLRAIAQVNACIWIEDTGVQNGAAYQGFTNFLVIARDNGFALEEIIHKMTGKTAERFKMDGRGVLEKGSAADITVFDLHGLSVEPDNHTFTSDGIKFVFVNGVKVVSEGIFTPAKVGQFLKKAYNGKTV